MKKRLTRSYILSRVAIALLMGILIGYKTFWWSGALVSVAAMAFFLWAPGSGRYTAEPGDGALPLRRDERSRAIRDRAGRDAFITLLLATAALLIYFGWVAPASVPLQALMGVCSLGLLTYFVSDALQRQNPSEY